VKSKQPPKGAGNAPTAQPFDDAIDAGSAPLPGEQGKAEVAEPDSTENVEPEELRDLRLDLEEMKERALRSQAELENYRKRVARQMDDERRYAELYLIRDLLPLVDNIRRAIDAAEKAGESPTLLHGFQLVAKQLDDLLAKHGCIRIEALHRPFDPHLHEAISQLPSAEHEPHTVLHVTQEGFTLHDRVVRPSQVIVSAAAPDSRAAGDGQQV
jgi:molecular chaperone GrpE